MKLEKAFSTDIKLNITAQEADIQFIEGSVKSKFNFKCPDENCDASVTCANLDRPKDKRKRDPYYKIVGDHSYECALAIDIEAQKREPRTSFGFYSNSDEYIDDAVRLNMQPPCTKRPEKTFGIQVADQKSGKARSGNDQEHSKRKIQHSKTLSSLIDSFLANESHKVQLPQTALLHINDLFVEIKGQDLSKIEDEYRIYYGKAWFNKKENGYSIFFANSLTLANITKRPSTYISLNKLEESGFKRFNINTLTKISDGRPKLVFLLSETGPCLKNGYINIWCEGPEYLDYRLKY